MPKRRGRRDVRLLPASLQVMDRLLIVHRDRANRERLSLDFASRGYAVDVACDSSGVLEKIGRAHYDLVLLDQKMPGLTGLDLVRLLRATYTNEHLPVVMVTPLDHSEPVFQALGSANSKSETSRARLARD